MRNWFLKGESLLLRAGALITAVTIVGSTVIGIFVFFLSPEKIPSIPNANTELSGPVAIACDARSEPVTQRLAGGLARLDCDIKQIRICDFQDSAKSAAETSHGMESHLMQVSAELSGKRFPIIGNGRGAQAEQLAFDNLYNNLILVLEENNLCR